MNKDNTLVLLGIDTQHTVTRDRVINYVKRVDRILESSIPKEDVVMATVIFNTGLPEEVCNKIMVHSRTGTTTHLNFLLEGEDDVLIRRVSEYFSKQENNGSILIVVLEKKDQAAVRLKLHVKEGARTNQLIQIFEAPVEVPKA